jgi:hypothetical protein
MSDRTTNQTSTIERVGPDKDLMRIVEKCLDVLLSDRPENHEIAREIAKDLVYPRWVVRPIEDLSKNWTDYSFEHAAEDFPKGVSE